MEFFQVLKMDAHRIEKKGIANAGVGVSVATIGGFGVSKRVDGLFSLADALVVHAQRHANNGLPSQLFIGGNALKHHIALSLRETYGESRLEVFVDVNNT